MGHFNSEIAELWTAIECNWIECIWKEHWKVEWVHHFLHHNFIHLYFSVFSDKNFENIVVKQQLYGSYILIPSKNTLHVTLLPMKRLGSLLVLLAIQVWLEK